jgi:uncharacterized protein
MRRKLFLSFVLLILFLFVGVLVSLTSKKNKEVESTPEISDVTNKVTVGQSIFDIEMATTYESRSLGLSGRVALPENYGMLFLFNEPGSYGFWMKDMNFPLDVIWIAERRVVGFEENVPPEGNRPTKTYFPPVPVTEVLEINAGLVSELGIRVGDVVKLGSNR